MSNLPPRLPDSPVSGKKFPWGCLLGGCASVLVLVLLGTSLMFYAGYRLVRSNIEAYTSEQPVEIPAAEYSKEEIASAKKRIDDFKTALDKGEDQEPLVLTSDDINAMINGEKELAGRLFVKIDDGEISGEASFPADAIPFGKGRYFNGSVSLKASLDNGVLIVTVDKATVNGKPLPDEFMDAMRNENLAKDAYRDPKSAEFLRKFESLTIDDDKIILTPAKKKPADESNQPTAATPAQSDSPAQSESPADSQPSTQAEITESTDLPSQD